MIELFEHLTMGFCLWDIPLVILLIVVTALFFVRKQKLSKKKKELQDQLSKQ